MACTTIRHRRLFELLAAAVLFTTMVVPDLARAQKPRTRTLKYEPTRRTWVEDAPPTPGTPAASLQAIRVLLKERKARRAWSALRKLERRVGADHELYPNLLIAKAEALIGRERYDEALETLQEFLNRFRGMSLTAEALRLEYVIAEAYLGGAKRKWLGFRLLFAGDKAIEILDDISMDYRDHRIAELAVKLTADAMFDAGDHALAELEYERLMRDFPQSRYARYALRRSADAEMASFGGIEYDEGALLTAEERYDAYRQRYPAEADHEGVGAIIDSIGALRAEKDLSIAAYYDRTGHVGSAVYYYGIVRREWPDTAAARKAAKRLKLLGVDATETSATR